MKIAVCDDEQIFQRQIAKMLDKYYNGLDILIRIFSSGEELLEEYKRGHLYDVLFLDIEMDGLNGIATAKKIREQDQKAIIVFLTNHTEFAMAGYEVSVLRFLSKPIKEDKLLETLQEVNKRITERKKLVFHTAKEEITLDLNDILYMESMGNNICFYTISRNDQDEKINEIIVRKKMKKLVEELKESRFYRCHRSYMINLDYVISYNKHEIKMKMNIMVPMSRGKNKELREKMIENIKNQGI